MRVLIKIKVTGAGWRWTDDYQWILARTQQSEEDALAIILAEAQRRGDDTSKLIWVK